MPELDGEVFVLNNKNFESTLANYGVALVKFYAPWYAELLHTPCQEQYCEAQYS
jgi:hypothetical protein